MNPVPQEALQPVMSPSCIIENCLPFPAKMSYNLPSPVANKKQYASSDADNNKYNPIYHETLRENTY